VRTLSFAWTTPAVLASHFQPDLTCKTRTRRDWASKTQDWWFRLVDQHGGVHVKAWDKSPRFGGKPFGVVLVHKVTLNAPACAVQPANWTLEGFDMLQAIGQEFQKGHSALSLWRWWRSQPENYRLTVIDFRLVEVNEYGRQLWRELEARHGEVLRRRLSLEEAMRG